MGLLYSQALLCFDRLLLSAGACMLTVKNIQIDRGLNTLLRGVSFSVSPGDLITISGGNGVGKSSLLAAVVGLLSVSAGKVQLNAPIFYLGHKRGLRTDLSILENLQQDIRYYFNPAVLEEALIACGLQGMESRLLRTLSAGQKQRVALAKLWFTDAPLWVLDEPLEALDAAMRGYAEKKIRCHIQGGGAAIIATHIPLMNHQWVTQEIELEAYCAI